MPNLYLAYPSIPFDAKVRTINTGSFDSDRPLGNTIYGERYQYAIGTCSGNAIAWDYDLGVGYTGGVDHVILPNAYKLIQQGATTLELYSSTDASAYSLAWTDASFASATLRGPDSLDYITTGLSLTAKRAWRFKISGTTFTTAHICKVYFGSAWSSTKDADFSYSQKAADGSFINLEDGATKMIRLADGRYQISLKWLGVSDANAQTFYDRVNKYWTNHKYILFTTGEHRILNSFRAIHVRVISEPIIEKTQVYTAGSWVGLNSISAEFQEVKG